MPPRRASRADLGEWTDRALDESARRFERARSFLNRSWLEWRVAERAARAWIWLREHVRHFTSRAQPALERLGRQLGTRDTWALFWARTRFRASLTLSWLAQGQRRYWAPAVGVFVVASAVGLLTLGGKKSDGGALSNPPPQPTAPSEARATPAGRQDTPSTAVPERQGVDVASLPVVSTAPTGARDPRFAVRGAVSLPSCDDAMGTPFRVEPKANPAMAGDFWTRSRKSLMIGKKDRALVEMCQSAAWDLGGRGTYGLSEYYFQENDFDKALLWAERVPNGSRRFVDARSMIGDIHSQQGYTAAALDAFLRGWNMAKDDTARRRLTAARFVLSAAKALRKGDFWTAERYYRRAAALELENPEAAAGLSRVLLHFERPDVAKVWAEQALSIDPKSSLAALALCEAEIARRNRVGARAALAKLQKLAPNDTNLERLAKRIDALR
jgi:hypothetical protein